MKVEGTGKSIHLKKGVKVEVTSELAAAMIKNGTATEIKKKPKKAE
jgi:hypothetical protein